MKSKTLLLSTLFALGTATVWSISMTGDIPWLPVPTSPIIPLEIPEETEETPDTFPPIKDRTGDFITDPNNNPFDLRDPKVVEQFVEYDAKSGYYIITEKIGNFNYRPPMYLTLEEYLEWREENEDAQYMKNLSQLGKTAAGKDPVEPYKDRISKSLVDRLFCGSNIDIRPQGNIDLTFGADYQRIENPILTERQQRQGGFDFDMNINLSVVGTIGQKLKLSFNYNTQATFDFDRQVKIEYLTNTECSEDDIIKKIEAGNVSFPLRSSLIQGRQNLFGFRTDLQFGRLTTSIVASQSQTKRKELQIQGGAQLQTFEVTADRYDENRHFFLAQYNRNTYEGNLTNMPQINTLFEIQKIEVWVTNDRNVTEGVRDIVSFIDLGETEADKMVNPALLGGGATQARDLYGNRLADNDANTLYQSLLASSGARQLENAVSTLQSSFGMTDAEDFSKVRMRKLAASEFTYHPKLGFVSLNVSVKPTDVIAVAYQYTYNGKTFQVGEFAQDLPISADTLNVMFMKQLKGVRRRVDLPIWDLMMKNVYSLGAYQINNEDFMLDVYYQDPGGGEKRFIPEGPVASKPLLTLLNLDKLNRALDPMPDGQFDFVSGVTILPQNGRVIFPVLEPFGDALKKHFYDDAGNLNPLAQKYVYSVLYDSTVTRAREYPEFNRYIIRGRYKSSVTSEISLGGFNIPRGSVTVQAGGAVLVEGTDYTIDYNLGRLKILNEAYLNSGQPIRVSFEDNSTFGFNRQSFFGTRLDYFINKNFNIGATFLHLLERPFTQKVNYGEDPISNTIYGLDIQYSGKAPWLTKAIDFLPLLSTKAESKISFSGEFAHLIPGAPNVINQGNDEGGIVYVDDFEGSSSNFNLSIPPLNWTLASTPRNDDNPLFPEASLTNDWDYGKNRARINWFQLDPNLVTNPSTGTSNDALKSVYVKQILQQHVYKNVTFNAQTNQLIRTFDVVYYPKERGPYNYSTENVDPSTGLFSNPKERWGGIQRSLQNNDFEANNIEFVEVWVLSPFKEGMGGDGGDLYLEFGDVSEDVLKDSRLFFENGIPDPTADQRMDTTEWGQIPRTQAITRAFDNNPSIRDRQDIGLDGFDNEGERMQYQQYLNDLAALVGTSHPVYQAAFDDPSGDDFVFYRDSSFENGNLPLAPPGVQPIIGRYKHYNNPSGNSSGDPNVSTQTVSTATNVPDTEDINADNTLNEEESYFQYRIPIKRVNGDEVAWTQYTVDSVRMDYDGPNGPESAYWYQMKIPLDQFTAKVGGIQDFRSIRFVRMYMTGFSEETILRFARLDLIRNQWRRYQRSLTEAGAYLPGETSNSTSFDVNSMNIEENGGRAPYPYVMPPGVQREAALGALPGALQNEQSLAMTICGLEDGDARAVYKNLNMDMRVYKRLRMFVHAEDLPLESNVSNDPGDLSLFIRMGGDYESNYYEYEIPLTMSFNEGSDQALDVWLAENNLDMPLDLLRNIKITRNAANASLTSLFSQPDPDNPNNLVKIIGNPDLNFVKGVMVGIRNKKDDGLPRCVLVWINELRLMGFDERGGTAGLARLDIQMADFANITFSGGYKTIGFGSIEQRVNERLRERTIQYDVSGTFNVDKFFPSKWKVRLPFYAQYSQEIRTPEYDPYQLDIPLKEKLRAILDGDQRDSVRRQAETIRTISSYNFTNVRKERTSKILPFALPWDISNFTFTYAASRNQFHSPIIAMEERKENRGIIDYSYKIPIKPITPFKKVFKKPSKWLALIQDFNFQPLPNSIGFRSEMIRRYGETTYRFADSENSTWYDKKFTWDRAYNLQWDFTKSLKFNFTATNNGIIDEPYGKIDTKEERDSIWTNVLMLGRNKHYQHNINVSYQLPFSKLPITDWIDARAQYTASYNWTRSSLNTDSLGNVIGNTQNRQLSADFNFNKLYSKSDYLKKIMAPPSPNSNKPKGDDGKKDDDKKDDDGKDDGKTDGKDKKDDKDKKREPTMIEKILIRPFLLIQKAKFTYNEDFTTVLPGFMGEHKYLGMDKQFSKPGWDFIAGWQPNQTWLNSASSKGWITRNIFQNQQFIQTHNLQYNGRVTIEPYLNFKIDVDIDKTLSENYSENFKVEDELTNEFRHLNPMRVGTVTMSYLPIKTMGDLLDTATNKSELFRQFESNREVISQLIGTGVHDDTLTNENYTNGYGRYQQDVLIPAFLTAYTGRDINSLDADDVNRMNDVRKLFPMPNWRLTFNGLTKMKGFSKIFSSFSLTHGYKSTLTVNRFATDLDFQENPTQKDPNTSNYYSVFEVPNIVISEQFSPLVGVDMRFKNGLTAKFEYKKSRNLSMSFVDYQLSEQRTEDITLSMGHTFKDFKPFKLIPGWKKRQADKEKNNKNANKNKANQMVFAFDFGKTIPKNELAVKFDFSYRNDKTVNHILDQQQSVATRGMKTIRIAPSIDYIINNRLTVRLFFDYSRTIPAVSTSYPITNTKGGVTIRFSLAQ